MGKRGTSMNGKTLAELRTEIELGLTVYQVPDGYCGVYRDRGDGMYVYSSYQDDTWTTFEQLASDFAGSLWSTLDAYPEHPSIEDAHAHLNMLEEHYK